MCNQVKSCTKTWQDLISLNKKGTVALSDVHLYGQQQRGYALMSLFSFAEERVNSQASSSSKHTSIHDEPHTPRRNAVPGQFLC